MFSLFIGFALLSTTLDSSVATCTAERLRPFVTPQGVKQSWPKVDSLPARLKNEVGTLIADQGSFDDGYSHWLVIDEQSSTAYVVQRGGFSGLQVVYGPLPVASCAL